MAETNTATENPSSVPLPISESTSASISKPLDGTPTTTDLETPKPARTKDALDILSNDTSNDTASTTPTEPTTKTEAPARAETLDVLLNGNSSSKDPVSNDQASNDQASNNNPNDPSTSNNPNDPSLPSLPSSDNPTSSPPPLTDKELRIQTRTQENRNKIAKQKEKAQKYAEKQKKASTQSDRMKRYNKAFEALCNKNEGSVTVTVAKTYMVALMAAEENTLLQKLQQQDSSIVELPNGTVRPNLEDVITEVQVMNIHNVSFDEFANIIKGIKSEKKRISSTQSTFAEMVEDDSATTVSVEKVANHLAHRAIAEQGSDFTMTVEERAEAHAKALVEINQYIQVVDATGSGYVNFPKFWQLTNGQRTRANKEREKERQQQLDQANQLPEINEKNFQKMFNHYSESKRGIDATTINEKQLAKWILATKEDFVPTPTLDVAEAIVVTHGQLNNGNRLTYNELQQWLHQGSLLADSDKQLYGNQSDIFRNCVSFLESLQILNNEDIQSKFMARVKNQDEETKEDANKKANEYDLNDSSIGLTPEQLFVWLMEEHTLKSKGVESLELAQFILDECDIRTTGTNNTTGLVYTTCQALLEWFELLSRTTHCEREKMIEEAKRYDDALVVAKLQFLTATIISSSSQENNDNWLPAVNERHIQLIFDSYDADGDGGINAEELLSWLVDEGKNDGVNYVGQNNEAKMKLNDQIDKKNILELFGPPNIALCDRIIKIHDDDGDGRLQFEELRDWLVAGCKLTKSKRRLLRVKSPIYYHSVTFLEQVARGVALQGSVDEEENEEEEEDEETKQFEKFEINEILLKSTFDNHSNGNGLNSKELLAWILEAEKASNMYELEQQTKKQIQENSSATFTAPDVSKTNKWSLAAHIPPTLLDAAQIIKSHDTDGDGLLQLEELLAWVVKGSTLPNDFRKKLSQRGRLFKHSIEFLERLVKHADQYESADGGQQSKKEEEEPEEPEEPETTASKYSKTNRYVSDQHAIKKRRWKKSDTFTNSSRTLSVAYSTILNQVTPSYTIQRVEAIALVNHRGDSNELMFRKHDLISVHGSCDQSGTNQLESELPQTNSDWWFGTNATAKNNVVGHFRKDMVKIRNVPAVVADKKKYLKLQELQSEKLYNTAFSSESIGKSSAHKRRNRGGKAKQMNDEQDEHMMDESEEEKRENIKNQRRVVVDGVYLGVIDAPMLKMKMEPKNNTKGRAGKVLVAIRALRGDDTLGDGASRIKYHLKQNNIDLSKVAKMKKILLKYSLKKGYKNTNNLVKIQGDGNKKNRNNKKKSKSSTNTKNSSVAAAAAVNDAPTSAVLSDAEILKIASNAVKDQIGIDHVALSGIITAYDGDQDGALTIEEVLLWMTNARNSYGGEHGMPVLADATMLVQAFDNDASNTLDENELSLWLQEGVELTHEERMEMAITSPEMEEQGASHPRVMEFMTNVLLSLDDSVLSTDECPPTGPDEISVVLLSDQDENKFGSCTINSALCVSSMVPNGVVEQSGVQLGDRLVRVGTDNLVAGVNGNQFSKHFAQLIEDSGRPLEMRFRRDNGLPVLNRSVLRSMFDVYDCDQSGNLDSEELRQWMLDLNVDAVLTESPSTMDMDLGPPTKLAAKLLIAAHDDNGDQVLDYTELEHWVAGGSRLLPKQRRRYAGRGENFGLAVRFLEHLIVDSSRSNTYEAMKERKEKNNLNNTVDRKEVESKLNTGEYLWDITSNKIGFVLDDYHQVVQIIQASSAASMGDISLNDVLVRINEENATAWTSMQVLQELTDRPIYPIHVVFQKSFVNPGEPPRKSYLEEQRKKETQNYLNKNKDLSIQEIAARTPLTKIYLDSNKRKEMGYLPRLHRNNLYNIFQTYATENGSLNGAQLLQWMIDEKTNVMEEPHLFKNEKSFLGESKQENGDGEDSKKHEVMLVSKHSSGLTYAMALQGNNSTSGTTDAAVVVVASVDPNSQGEKAGIQVGWIVTSVNLVAVKNVDKIASIWKQEKNLSELIFEMSEEVPSAEDAHIDAADDGIEDHVFDIDVSLPMGLSIDNPAGHASHYPAVICKITPNGQADLKGVQTGMHIHTINGKSCRDKKKSWLMNIIKEAKQHSKLAFVFHEPEPIKEGAGGTGSDEEEDKLTLGIANEIIAAHDDNNDGLLQWKEFLPWIAQGITLRTKDRNRFAKRTELHKQIVRFVERVVMSAANAPGGRQDDDWLPYLSTQNLKILFDRHDLDGNEQLDKYEMLKWMMEIMMVDESNSKNHPTLEMAEIIIRAHDNREVNGVLEYQELKEWILEGSTLSPKERSTYSDLGENERLMTIFLEKVIQQSTFEAASLKEEEDNQAQHAKQMLLLVEDGGKQTDAKEGVVGVGVGGGAAVETPPAQLLKGTFYDGPLGIQFTNECCVDLIQRGSQACEFHGLSKGDLMVSLNGVSVKGSTFKDALVLLDSMERPIDVVFERHTAWKRNGETGLPHVDWVQLEELFLKHTLSVTGEEGGEGGDDGEGGSVECAEFAKFMSEIHEMAMGHQGRQPIEQCDMASMILAQKLIDAHDENDDGRLDWSELKLWLNNGLSMSVAERMAYKARGGYCPDSVRFLEDVAHGCHIPQAQEDWLLEEAKELEEEKKSNTVWVQKYKIKADIVLNGVEEEEMNVNNAHAVLLAQFNLILTPEIETELVITNVSEKKNPKISFAVSLASSDLVLLENKVIELSDAIMNVSTATGKQRLQNNLMTEGGVVILMEDDGNEGNDGNDGNKRRKKNELKTIPTPVIQVLHNDEEGKGKEGKEGQKGQEEDRKKEEQEEQEEKQEEKQEGDEEDEHTFSIDLLKPLDMAIDEPNKDNSHYPAVIVALKPNGQAEQSGVEVGMHIHYIDEFNCRDQTLDWVMDHVNAAKIKAEMIDPKNTDATTSMKMIMAKETPSADNAVYEKRMQEKKMRQERQRLKKKERVDRIKRKQALEMERKQQQIDQALKFTRLVEKRHAPKASTEQTVKSLDALLVNEAVLRKMFDDYDVDDVGTFTGQELLRWINESTRHRNTFLHLPKLSIDKNNGPSNNANKEDKKASKADKAPGGTTQSKKQRRKKNKQERSTKHAMKALGTRILWALAWGMGGGGDTAIKDKELEELGNNLSFRSFVAWVRQVVTLTDNNRQQLIKTATKHHIGGEFVEDEERQRKANERKRDVAAFLGLSFVDTIVRLACRGPVDNQLPVVDYEYMKTIYDQYGIIYQWSGGRRVLTLPSLKALMDDLVVASLYRTVAGGKYTAAKSKYGRSNDPIDNDIANDMLQAMGGGVGGDNNNLCYLTFELLEKWVMVNCYKSIYERYQTGMSNPAGSFLMTLLERLVIASSCNWMPPGYQLEQDWVSPTSQDEQQRLKQLLLDSRDKTCSTEVAHWRNDPRLDHIPIQEIPIPILNYQPNRGCGIRMDLDMTITSVRPNSNAEILGLKEGDTIVSILGEGEGNSNSDFIFSKKRKPGDMISLLSAEDMYPIRLVAIRPENEDHSLPSLVSEPTTQDFEQSKKTKKEVPDYMKSISTGVNDRKAQQAKYRAQVAEQRKRLLSRERRTKERKRLNKRADLVKKREQTIQEKRMQQLNNACDDTEAAWLHWDTKDTVASATLTNPSTSPPTARVGTALERHHMKVRLEVLKTIEESDYCSGDKMAALTSTRQLQALDYIVAGNKSVSPRTGKNLVESIETINIDVEGGGNGGGNGGGDRYNFSSSNNNKNNNSLFRTSYSSSRKQQQPVPPKKGRLRRQWHLFQPNPEVEKQRRKILEEKRKRIMFKKEKEQQELLRIQRYEEKLINDQRKQNEQREKYKGKGTRANKGNTARSGGRGSGHKNPRQRRGREDGGRGGGRTSARTSARTEQQIPQQVESWNSQQPFNREGEKDDAFESLW